MAHDPPSDAMHEDQAAFPRSTDRSERAGGETELASPAADTAAAYAIEEHEILGRIRDDEASLQRGAAAGGLTRDIRSWRQVLHDYDLDQPVANADELLAELAHRRADDWIDANLKEPLPEDARALFQRLANTTLLQVSLPKQGQSGNLAEQFQAIRDRLRETLVRAVELVPPDEETRTHWTTAIVDRADSTITAIDEVSPEAAARQLSIVMDDLSWHRAEIESKSGPRRRRLGRRFRRLRAERQERQLQARLEGQFGPPRVARFERMIFWLIFLVLGLILYEFIAEPPPRTVFWLNIADGIICAVFLWEFFYKLALAQGKWLWFRRHALIDLLPSIPFGLLTIHASPADALRAGRTVRLVRLSRLVRYIRILRPFIRLVRAFGFLLRGLDRLARSYGKLLNWNIILFPTREERHLGKAEQEGAWWRLRDARIAIDTRWRELLSQTDDEERAAVAEARLAVFRSAALAESSQQDQPASNEESAAALREVPAELALRRLASTTPQEVRMVLGNEVTRRVARRIRTFSWPPMRWMPVISAFAPKISRKMSDEEVVAAAAHSSARRFGKYYARYLWMSDLYGTVTPSEFLDRLGGILVKVSFRPTYRLALFGGLFLLTRQILVRFGGNTLEGLRNFLENSVGTPLLIIGGVCVFVLGIGWWLKRLARESTEFHERAVHAQFLALTEDFRSRHLNRDSGVLHDRVLKAEWRLVAKEPESDGDRQIQLEELRRRVHASLAGIAPERGNQPSFDLLERAALIYRDSLDGAMFADSDTRATAQLLGNPAIQQAIAISARVHRRDKKEMNLLDLDRQKSLFGGPYLWFNFISRSMAHTAAVLILDYNRNAIPTRELPLASASARRRYESWLSAESEAFDEPKHKTTSDEYTTTTFTALHFLDDDPGRDEDVLERFGEAVRDKMRRDRGLLFRRVFGTYPLHRRQKEKRTLNVFVLYEKYLGGGKAVFLPVVMFLRALGTVRRCFSWVGKAIAEVRSPDRRARYDDAADADFATAVRKIDRMRGPVTRAAIALRAKLDPAYLGIALPGEGDFAGARPWYEEDLRFLDADPKMVRRLRDARRRAVRDVRRLESLFAGGLLHQLEELADVPKGSFDTDEHRRAATVAYCADYHLVRSLISCGQILDRVADVAPSLHLPRRSSIFAWRRKRTFRRWWKSVRLKADSKATLDPDDFEATWRAVANNLDGAGNSLLVWGKHDVSKQRGGKQASGAEQLGLRRLAELMRHPNRISEHLVTIRTIQTLAMLDVLHYRTHVFRLGGYAQTEDDVRELLTWQATPAEQRSDEFIPHSLLEAGEEAEDVIE